MEREKRISGMSKKLDGRGREKLVWVCVGASVSER